MAITKNELDLSESTILLVDDVSFNRELIRQLFRSLGGPEVYEAGDGVEAMEILVQSGSKIDFVVADFNMPNMTGLELLKAVRLGEQEVNRSTPIAMLTAHSDVDLVESALSLDVNAFLVKPVSREMLEKRLSAMLVQIASDAWVKPRSEYRQIDASAKNIRKVQARQVSEASVDYFPSIPAGSPASKEISISVNQLLAESGEAVAARVLSRINGLIDDGTLPPEQVPRLLETINIKARARGERMTVPEPDRGERSKGIKVSVAEPDRGGPSAKEAAAAGLSGLPASGWTTDADQLAKAMEEIKNGAPLNVDVYMKDGQLFVEAGTPMTPKIFSIMINLDDIAQLKNMPELEQLIDFSRTSKAGAEAKRAQEISISDIKEGQIVARDINTADGRVYIHKGQKLNSKFVSMLNVAMELGHVGDTIWVHD